MKTEVATIGFLMSQSCGAREPISRAAPAAQPSARRGNPNVPNTAARYVAKAMTRVHPAQRAELLASMIDQAADALAHITGRTAA